ncbi:maleylpyruvate isomerase family mycothiol-dependent enzyme [Dictyobacter formicarum]|uniref:Mycothiol-dependent maleylpyruvate isomerase metal-binding domain-containing protein n=1 Tax=Dictyobacter formicarum TaxID=2778368 RepID=A0ABQ3VTB9_9CHLR|nr:maleylpyruvate isomerase family mycothiol-dependent enzyme [Dictyobacter formicarum]GHO88808.1 hypothetical protein KSZ_68140 [Dictyobacter formicarum]
MQPVEPIIVVDLFEPLLDRLLLLLRQLSAVEWQRPTPCEGWSVKDIALHLLGDEMGQLSRGRDKDTSYSLKPGPDLVSRINEHNALWVEATRRISTPLLCELLDSTGHEVVKYFKSRPLMEMGGPVSWAGPEPAPIWLDVAREYTERWHHQQHIREALQQPGLTEAAFLTPVLDTFMRALPYTFRAIEAPEHTVIQLSITGEAGRSWFLMRNHSAWSLFTDTAFEPAAIITIDQQTTWCLLTKGLTREQALARASTQGNTALALPFFSAVSIIA